MAIETAIKTSDGEFEVKPVVWADNPLWLWKRERGFHVPGYGEINVDIQTVSDEALEKILKKRAFYLSDIPSKKEIIPGENQSDYYMKIKQEIINRILTKKFAIVQWPTGTWKTTIVKTIGYEMQLPVYEVGADAEKAIDDFAKEIKTFKKWNTLQVKELPGILIKAITQWGIFLINEANTLSPDIQVALANMLESGFVIVWTKKYLVHPNFALIFTSNQDYAWTNPYNAAVIRKAWWIVNFDYEPSLEWEEKVVKTIYEKIMNEISFDVEISDEDLKKVAKFVRSFREKLREYNYGVSLKQKFLSQDLNDAWHFLYIRFYEKLLKDILISGDTVINFKKLAVDLFVSYLQEKIVWWGSKWEYIDHINDIEKLKSLISEWFPKDYFIGLERREKDDKVKLDPDLAEEVLELLNYDLELLEEAQKLIDFSLVEKEQERKKTRQKLWFTRGWINPNLLKKVLSNEVKSYWERLRRTEGIAQIAQYMYERLVDTHRKKVIWNIEYREHDIYWPILIVEINKEPIIFKVKDWQEFDLRSIETEKDVLEKIFGNDDLEIVYEDEVFENVFAPPKSLEIRRFSKMIDYGDKIVFLWFRGEIRDIRYVWEESWKFYIPQSKVNDLLLRTYKVLNENEIQQLLNGNEKKEGHHVLILNDNDKIEFITISELRKRLDKSASVRVLQGIKDENLEAEIRQRFAHVDKLNLHNWVEEMAETWIVAPVYGRAYPLQRAVEQKLSEAFDIIPGSIEKLLNELKKYLESWEDLLLIWPSGVWKSSVVRELAERLGLPYIDLQITENLQEGDLQTKLAWNEWEIENVFTPFLDYWINGWVVELKELNMAPVLTFLNNFLDENWQIRIGDRVYRRHPNFHLVATMNPFDNRIYPWTKPLNLAVQARFRVVNLTYLDKEEEKEVLINIAKEFKEKLLKEWLEEVIDEILNLVVIPIRNKIKELMKTQTMWTDEALKILAEKNVTIDIMIRWIKTAKSIEDIKNFVRQHFSMDKEKVELLPEDIRVVIKDLLWYN